MMTAGGKDLLNMDFRIKAQAYNFVGAGTRFKYTRDALKKEKITAQGPLTENVELMVCWEDSKIGEKICVKHPSERSSIVHEC